MTTDSIFKAQPEQLSQIMQIEKLCFDSEAFNQRQMQYLIRSQNYFYVIESEGCVAAYIILLKRKNSKSLRLYAIAVAPFARGKGYAKKLISKAIEIARQNEYKMLSLEVKTDNHAAISLYQSLGFQKLKLLTAYYKDHSDAVKMVLYPSQ